MITYKESATNLTADSLRGGFFNGWSSRPAPETHLRIQQSDHVVLAFEGDRVVGFINALSDGGFMAYIALLEVLSTHRRRGIGAQLVRRMLARLRGHYHVGLTCDADIQPFYDRLGLRRVSGMVYLDVGTQSGLSIGPN